MISHYQMKAILRSESNFSFSYNFFLVRPKNQFREVKYQKNSEKKDYEKIGIIQVGK